MGSVLLCDNDQVPAVSKLTDPAGENVQFLCPGCLGIFGLGAMVAAGIITEAVATRFWELAQEPDTPVEAKPAAKRAAGRKRTQPQDTPAGAPSTVADEAGKCVLKLEGCMHVATTTVDYPDSEPWPVCLACAAVYAENGGGEKVV